MDFRPLRGRVHQVRLSPAGCSVDLGTGSERGEFVSQDYILGVLGRPHRAINIIYCYYPFDKGWPGRASEVFRNQGGFIWGYPYDDYFPYRGGLGGDRNAEVFRQLREIRRHGQDVTFTLTADCAITDDHIRAIARDLKPFGHLRLRLNHECDGSWFQFNRRYSYAVVAQFFARFAKIVHAEAPNIRMVSCWGTLSENTTWGAHSSNSAQSLDHEADLAPTLAPADVWSTDRYLALHFGWPFKRCEPNDRGKTYSVSTNRELWTLLETAHRRFCALTGQDKGLELCEFNVDGTVGGRRRQARRAASFYREVLRKRPPFLKAITYYQFRDRARLGLEREDPNSRDVGAPSPFLPVYKRLIEDPYFRPGEHWSRSGGELDLEWRSSDDSDGLGWKIKLASRPIFLELLLGTKENLMVQAGRTWYYKKPGVELIDVTSAAEQWPLDAPFPISLFAPPANGMNPGGRASCRSRLSEIPQIRLLYRWGAPA
jgi:hypothetical protein